MKKFIFITLICLILLAVVLSISAYNKAKSLEHQLQAHGPQPEPQKPAQRPAIGPQLPADWTEQPRREPVEHDHNPDG